MNSKHLNLAIYVAVLGAFALVTAGSIWASEEEVAAAPIHTAALLEAPQLGDDLGEVDADAPSDDSGIFRRPGFDPDFRGPVNPDNGPGMYVDGTTEPQD